MKPGANPAQGPRPAGKVLRLGWALAGLSLGLLAGLWLGRGSSSWPGEPTLASWPEGILVLVANEDLPAGATLGRDHLTRLRVPRELMLGKLVDARHRDFVLGRLLSRPLRRECRPGASPLFAHSFWAWGTFDVQVRLLMQDGAVYRLDHGLSF